MDAQRLPRLRRLLRKLSAIGCRVLDRICTRLYLTQIVRRSANGHRTMQLRILAQQGGVNACALARWTHSVFHPAIFCFLLEILIHFIFRLHPKYTKSQRSKPPPRFPGAGVLPFAEGVSPSLNLLRCSPRMAGPCSCGHTASSAPAASPTQAFCYRLPGT